MIRKTRDENLSERIIKVFQRVYAEYAYRLRNWFLFIHLFNYWTQMFISVAK